MRDLISRLSTDVYHRMLRLTWTRLIGLFALLYLGSCALFAASYFALEGAVAGAAPDSFLDHLWFSVQTVSTIGYGGMEPARTAAHVLVIVQSFVGILGFAVATGLVFSKFSRPTSQIVFSDVLTIRDRGGRPTLHFRVANERSNYVVEASLSLYLLRDETDDAGETIRRFYPLDLERNHTPVFGYSFLAMHELDETSPLSGVTPENLTDRVTGIVATVRGIDETMASEVHARKFYDREDIRFDEAFADMLTFGDRVEEPEVDIDAIDETVPADKKTGP